MGFCPQCGHPAAPGATACASCGASLVPAHVPGAPALDGPRPVGRTQPPGIVLLLVLVTLGIYTVVYWWRVSKEMDAYRGTPGHAHRPVRVSAWVSLVALVLVVVGFVALFSSLGDLPTDPEAAPEITEEQAAGFVGGFIALFVGGMGALVGMVFLYVGAWRVWRGIEEDERRRSTPSPLSPGMMLAFLLIPYVNLVTTWIAYWRTQRSLNAMWAAAAAPGVAEGRELRA